MNHEYDEEKRNISFNEEYFKTYDYTSNSEIFLDAKLWGPNKKKRGKLRKKTESTREEHPLEKFGKVRKIFIMEHIRTIDYNDIADLIDVKGEELKEAVEKMGIKLPIDHTRKWSDINVGTFRSLTDCARCRVQLNHSSFFVGINNCRKCYAKNIKHWIEINELIKLKFSHEEFSV